MKTTCRDIMTDTLPKLHPDQNLHDAIAVIHQERIRYLPVVADDGSFIGIFSSVTLLKTLMPQSLSIHMGAEVSDLNFMKTSLNELAQKLDNIGNEPVKDHLLQDTAPICAPDDSIMEAIFLLHKYHTHVIVLDEDQKTFLGSITISSILDHLSNPTK